MLYRVSKSTHSRSRAVGATLDEQLSPLVVNAIGRKRQYARARCERQLAEVHQVIRRVQIDTNIVEVFAQLDCSVQDRVQVRWPMAGRMASFIRTDRDVEMIPVDVVHVATRRASKSIRYDENVDDRPARLSVEAVQLKIRRYLAAPVQKQLLEEDVWLDRAIVTLAGIVVKVSGQPLRCPQLQFFKRRFRLVSHHLDEAATVIRLHHKGIRQRVENFASERMWRCDQRYQMLFADLAGNVLTNQKLVGQLDEARIRPEAALQNFFVEGRRTKQVRITANAFVMQQAQEQCIGQNGLGRFLHRSDERDGVRR